MDNVSNPRLVAIAGRLRGVCFPVEEDNVTIGREPSNRVSIQDPLVSRRHGVIRRSAGQFILTDLGSRNGTFVNGVPVKERALAVGDEIRIGDTLFVLLTAEPPSAAFTSTSTLQLDTRAIAASSLTGLAAPADAAGAGPQALDLLLRINKLLSSAGALKAFEEEILRLALEVLPADRGAILIGGQKESFHRVLGLDRNLGPCDSVSVVSELVNRVMNTGAALICNERPPSMAAPLQAFGRIGGVIYVESADASAHFHGEHLQALTALGAITALAFGQPGAIEWLENEDRRIQAEVNLNHNLVGESRKMLDVLQTILRVAPSGATVLIRGESGTGKEMAARAIHRNSSRASRPFVAINCAALPEQLIESELFGHEKGAFTGAYIQKKGRLELADGGTLFLDEVADLSLACQAKLLRMLQEREFERVGGNRAVRVDIRLIAATNKDLEGAVRNGSFRQDLFYRLNVVPLSMPPLRERREDIPLLARHFAARYSTQCKRPLMKISPEAIACLTQYDWPGNLRELENAIERAVVLASSETILPEDLPEAAIDTGAASSVGLGSFHDSVREAKRLTILKAVEQAGGSIAEAAAALGLQRTYLHRLMKNLDLKRS